MQNAKWITSFSFGGIEQTDTHTRIRIQVQWKNWPFRNFKHPNIHNLLAIECNQRIKWMDLKIMILPNERTDRTAKEKKTITSAMDQQFWFMAIGLVHINPSAFNMNAIRAIPSQANEIDFCAVYFFFCAEYSPNLYGVSKESVCVCVCIRSTPMFVCTKLVKFYVNSLEIH